MDIIKNILSTIEKRPLISNCSEADYDKKINICFGVDADFVRPMGVSMTSLAENNPNILLNFFVFGSLIKNDDLVKLGQLAEKYNNIIINLYNVDQEKFRMLPTSGWGSVAPYFRTIMPIVLKELDNILYLDSDIICLKNIEEIIDLDIDNNDKIAAVVKDYKKIGDEQARRFQLPTDTYFNSGVMKINIKKWNEQGISEKTLETRLKLPKDTRFRDQDSLNIVLNGKLIYLPQKWNHLQRVIDKVDIPEDTVLLHCAANPKPWKLFCNTVLQPYYLKYEQLSPWKDTPLEMPVTYRETRLYATWLFRQGNILEGIKWYAKYIKMKRKIKKNIEV